MAILNQKRILNLIPKTSAPVTIHVSQGDVGTEIEFTLVKGDELFVNTGSLSASVHGVREDGANFGVFTCTLSGSSVKFPLHSEMTMVKGSAIAEIVLVDSQGNKVGSANFGIMVEESVFPLGVTYDNDVSVYESILAYVQTIPAQVTQDYNTKINAETAARQAADSSLNEALANEVTNRTNAVANEAATRAAADTALGMRIDEIIAPSGEAPSAAEVTDARVGADGVTYASLGAANRTQFKNANNLIDGYRQEDAGIYNLPISWELGYYSSSGVKNSSNGFIRSNITYKATDKYAYINLGSIPMKINIVDLTDGTTSGELTTSRYYSFEVGHVYAFNARRNDSGGTLVPDNGNTILITFYPKYMTIGECVTKDNYSITLPDANNAPINSIFRIVYSSANVNYPANLPDLTYQRRRQTFIATLETIAQYKNDAYYCTQKLTTYDAIYTRYKGTMGGSWSNWVSSQNTTSHQFALQVTDANIDELLPDLDNAESNAYYLLFITQGHDPLHSPEVISTTSIILVHTYGIDNYRVQMYQNKGDTYFRNYVNGTWTVWRNVSKPYTYIVGSHVRADYSSLVECIEEAIKYPRSTIYVDDGVYDIISEYSTLHPDDWETRNDSRGVNLQNDLTIIFGSGAKVVANYTGDNADVKTQFSVFNMRYGSAKLVNAVIEASNIRYCIHDDFWTSEIDYHNKYIGCKMKMDNSQNSERSKYPHCIGGGFGKHGDVEIRDCIFEGIGGDGTSYDAPEDSSIVAYHNGPNASQYSKLVLSGCYFKGNGTFRAMSNGEETIKSDLLISNNSFGSAIIEGFSSGYNVPNMNVMAFNNEIRV